MFFKWMSRCTSAIQEEALRCFEDHKNTCESTILLSFAQPHAELKFCAGATVDQVNDAGEVIATGNVWCGTIPGVPVSEVRVVLTMGTFDMAHPLNFKTTDGIEITSADVNLPNVLNPPMIHGITLANPDMTAAQRTALATQRLTAECGDQWAGGVWVGHNASLDNRAMDYEPNPENVVNRCPCPGGYEELWGWAKEHGVLRASEYSVQRVFLGQYARSRGIVHGHPALEGARWRDTGTIAAVCSVLRKDDELWSATNVGGNAALNAYNQFFHHLPTLEQSRKAKKRMEVEAALSEYFLFFSL